MDILRFQLEGRSYAVPIRVVGEVVRAVDTTPLAGAPAVVEGLIDYRGRIIPVFSLRRRFGLPERALRLGDVFIVVDAVDRLAALHVDAVDDITEMDGARLRDVDGLVQGGAHVSGAAALADGLVLLHDVATFLSAAERESLDAALAARRGGTAPA